MDYCALCGFPADDHWANCPNAPCPPPCPGPPILLGPFNLTAMNRIMEEDYLPTLIEQMNRANNAWFFRNPGTFRPDIKQNRQWARIGAGILPWIPATQTRVRDLRSQARLALGEFLIDHGVIEVPEDDNDYW